MIPFFNNSWNPLYWGWGGLQVPIRIDNPPTEPPKPKGDGPQTGDQNNYLVGGVNPMPGYAKAPAGCYQVWRWMDAEPTLVLGRVLIFGPILSGTRSFEVQAKPGTPVQTKRKTPVIGDGVKTDPMDARRDWLDSVLSPLLFELVRDKLDALSMGHQTHETVWGTRDAREVITDFKPLAHETTFMLVNQSGEFIGARNAAPGITGGSVDLYGRYCFNYANDARNRNPFGRPRHENCRQEWWDKRQKKIRMAELDRKAAGRSMIAEGPVGTGKVDSNGNAVDGPNPALDAANEIEKGRAVWVPRSIIGPPDPNQIKHVDYLIAYTKLAELSQFKFSQFDWGYTGPASLAILEAIKYLDSELMRGWHRPEREAMQAEHSSNADSGNHGDVGAQDSDMVHADICRAISKGPVNDLLVRNFGDDAADTIAIIPASVRDATTDQVTAFMNAIATNPDIATDIYKKLDKGKVFADMSLPGNEDVDPNEEMPPPQPAPRTPKPAMKPVPKEKAA